MFPRSAAPRRRAALFGLPVTAALLLGGCGPASPPGSGPARATGSGPVSGPAEPAPGRTAPATAGPETPCPADGVRIRATGSDAAMGLRAMGLELVNCGSVSYRLRGYPALRLFDADGGAITVRVVEGATGITGGFDDPPRSLTLRPGERAGAALIWRNLVTDPTVVATTAEGLEVAPVAGQPARAVDPDGPIDLGNTGRIGVSAWKKRTGPAPTPTTGLPGRPGRPEPTRSAPLP
ncbi:DUF4232 domain-containing protein [Micromonospora endolithica]|uniref:DUF4232 domain-containing protein n=1 Tax=Micromonospora endolithica TaxID=230091 RepID=A0A3A9YSW8_9ACTN|nr:DUF4232 domain-containing protein [Micromonospora endolithica]RKN39065.1 DUF4232 domain-containing protein [Micromonospora endolithica]TWJ25561.1 uncharacterized protein DUF4232 [Micromonospora endolithica]